jgi:hypothetical protein
MVLLALVVAVVAVLVALAAIIIVLNQRNELSRKEQAFDKVVADFQTDVKNFQTVLQEAVDSALADLIAKRKESDVEICRLKERLVTLEMRNDGPDSSTLPAVVDERMTEGLSHLTDRLTQMRQWADNHFIAAAGDAARTSVAQEELGRYITSTLDQEAAAAGSGILACGLYAQQPSALDILPPLAEELWSALGADLLYRQDDGPDGRRFYIRWPDGQQESKLRGLAYSAVTDNDTGQAGPEVTALQAILRAVYDGGPALLQLGPLLISRTGTAMCYGFARAGRLSLTAEQHAAVLAGSRPDLLRSLGAYGIIDLTGWSARRAAA